MSDQQPFLISHLKPGWDEAPLSPQVEVDKGAQSDTESHSSALSWKMGILGNIGQGPPALQQLLQPLPQNEFQTLPQEGMHRYCSGNQNSSVSSIL